MEETKGDLDLFGSGTPQFSELSTEQRQILIEHYKRCSEFWRHWTPTIWSLPSVAAAINIGAYSVLFDMSKGVSMTIKVLALVILVILNMALTFGVWKHRGMQIAFGDRLQAIERYGGIVVIELTGWQKKISASWLYVWAAGAVLLVSAGLLIRQIVCALGAA